MDDELLTPKQLSDDTCIPERTLAQWRYLGKGPTYIKLGGHVRYRVADVGEWLSENTRRTSNG